MALNKKTAFLVIHGIGKQKPFETLDAFGQGLVDALGGSHGELILSHALQPRTETSDPWYESFLRIQAEQGDGYIDVREYYWAHLTERQISTREIWTWLSNSLAGAKKLCAENEELKKRFQKSGGVYNWHLWRIRWLLFVFRIASFLRWPWVRFFTGKLADTVVGHIGDVAIYTTTDQKSRHFKIRQQVLKGALETIQHLLNKHKYDEVVVCGHSLGSVVAYDALNRLNIQANMVHEKSKTDLQRLRGFVSFGSPLDKIAYFFREHVDKQQYIRRQIIDQLFSFKAYQLRPDNHKKLVPPLQAKIDHIHWVNYHCDKDPISDHLVFCKLNDEDNVHLPMAGHKWGKAHTAYWRHGPFYQDIIARFIHETGEALEAMPTPVAESVAEADDADTEGESA